MRSVALSMASTIQRPGMWQFGQEHITAQEAQVYLSYPATMDITLSPGRTRRLDVAVLVRTVPGSQHR